MIHAKVKEECLSDYLEVAVLLTRETKGKRKGCVSYSFNQRQNEPTEFILYEQWQSEEDLNNHIAALVELLGPPKPGGILPERLANMYESGTPYYYNVIE